MHDAARSGDPATVQALLQDGRATKDVENSAGKKPGQLAQGSGFWTLAARM